MMARSFVALIPYSLPWWAANDEADGAYTQALAGLVDDKLTDMRAGLEQRFPSRAFTPALNLIGQDRLLPRGRAETDAHYATRLQAWRYPKGHRVRGNVFALLDQISAYWGGGFDLFGIDRRGNYRLRMSDGVEYYAYGYPWTWDTGAASSWSRQWIVIDGRVIAPEGDWVPWGDASLWGGAYGTPGYCIGIAGTSSEDWRAIIALTRGQHRWLPAGTQGEWLIVQLGSIVPAPDATWEKWGKIDAGVYVPAREPTCRYIALRAALREYAGDTDWANSCTTNDFGMSGTITGDPTDFPATITMLSGSGYAGDPTVFPATITLPDDGALPS